MTAALAPVWAWLRLDLRRRRQSLTVLALLVALSSAVVMAATAGARRGGSAMDRLLARTLPATVGVLANEPGFNWEPVRRLPGVAALTLSGGPEVRLEGLPDANVSIPADPDAGQTIERPVVLSGRLPDPARVDEAVATPAFLDRNHLELGDTVTALLYTPAEVDRFLQDPGVTPTGPRQTLRIVGVGRSPLGGVDTPGGAGSLLTTFAFFANYRANLMGTGANPNASVLNAFVRLTDGEAGVPAFQRAFVERTGRDDIDIVNWVSGYRQAKEATGFEAGVLLAFALAALVAAVVLLGQAVVRYTAVAVADLGILRTVGMTSRQAVLAAMAGPGLAAVVGAAVGAGAAVAVSGLFPIGAASYVEPDPGVRVDPVVLAGVAGIVVATIVAASALSAWFALATPERAASRPRRSAIAAAAYRLGLPVPVVVGARLALEPGRGRSAVPVRPALVAAVVGVLGVLAALTFRTGVVDAAENPARFGQTAQLLGFSGFNGVGFDRKKETSTRPVQEAWARDPDVVGVNDTRVGAATVGTTPLTVFSYAPVGERPLPVVTLSGRMPTGPDEIALAPDSVRTSGAKIGDTLTVAGREQAEARLRLTGIVFVPENPHNGYADGAWLTGAAYQRLFPDGYFKYHETHLALRPDTDVAAVTERLTATMVKVAGGPMMEVSPQPFVPSEIAQVRNVRVLPLALGVFLGVLAVGATAHTLATAVRRRRHDVAVLRALGITRRQSRLIVVTQATTIAVVGLLFGVPLGVALGRAVWRAVAHLTPLQYVPPIATLALALAGPAALLVGSLLAALPARRAARLRVGATLRAE
jgi:ABC-type lipoprotein release transport system permease subunit